MFILVGLAITALGVWFTVKSELILRAFGRVGLFEKYLGLEGGSRLGYKLIGVAIIFVGLVILTGMWHGFMSFITSPLTRFNR